VRLQFFLPLVEQVYRIESLLRPKSHCICSRRKQRRGIKRTREPSSSSTPKFLCKLCRGSVIVLARGSLHGHFASFHWENVTKVSSFVEEVLMFPILYKPALSNSLSRFQMQTLILPTPGQKIVPPMKINLKTIPTLMCLKTSI